MGGFGAMTITVLIQSAPKPSQNEVPIKNDRASLETPFSHYKYMGIFFRYSRAPNSVGSGPIWAKFELVRDFVPILVTCKFEKI